MALDIRTPMQGGIEREYRRHNEECVYMGGGGATPAPKGEYI